MNGCPEKPPEILLVEVDPAEVLLVKRSLEQTGICNKVHVAGDGKEALKILRNEGTQKFFCPDFILLDLKLPKMKGKDVLRAIKSDETLKPIPVVIFTTSEAVEDITDTYQEFANSTKPVNFGEFIKTIRSIEDFWLSVVKLPCRKGGWRPYRKGE